MIYADQRWVGQHGIGRFSRCVLATLDYRPVTLASHPAAPFDSLFLARSLRRLTANDLFFSPGYNTPLFCRAPFIFVIHDLSHIYCPENSSLGTRLYYATLMKRACQRADNILTVSEFTKKQIVEWSGVSSEKVCNVSCGVGSTYQPGSKTFGLPFPYLLCVSNRKRHKNEFRIVEAFGKADLDSRIHLVFSGRPTSHLSRWIEANQVGSRVDFVGPVPEQRLPSLYRGALAMVFPSLYEGFGLPVLEAMACGTPVVTANVTAMPEVAGDAALLVDPTSVDQIAEAIERVVSDRSLREVLRERGIIRAAEFSWATTTSRVHKLIAYRHSLCKVSVKQ